MKIIEAMKQIKDLQIKALDLRKKVSTYCADQDFETPVYGDGQGAKIKEWIQSHGDIIKRILELRVAIQRANLSKQVTIELGGKQVTKSIAEWVHRRRDLAELERSLWAGIGDRNLREGVIKTSTGDERQVKIRRYYNPAERDTFIETYRSEPSLIDATLETVNAVTEIDTGASASGSGSSK